MILFHTNAHSYALKTRSGKHFTMCLHLQLDKVEQKYYGGILKDLHFFHRLSQHNDSFNHYVKKKQQHILIKVRYCSTTYRPGKGKITTHNIVQSFKNSTLRSKAMCSREKSFKRCSRACVLCIKKKQIREVKRRSSSSNQSIFSKILYE